MTILFVLEGIDYDESLDRAVFRAGFLDGGAAAFKFHYDSPTSTNMVVMFEGGGACWD